MSPRLPNPRGLQLQSQDSPQAIDARNRRPVDLNRPLPAPPSSLPNEYEIPTLRRKPNLDAASNGQLGHVRSLSHPFPSLFGARRQEKRANQKHEEFDSSEEGSGSKKAGNSKASKGRVHKGQAAEKQPITGKCMTCDSTVRWPQDLKVFRCTTCLTINDLEPTNPGLEAEEQLGNGSGPRIMPASVDRTRRLIDSCLDDFFKNVLDGHNSPKSPFVETEPFLLSDDETSDSRDPQPPRPELSDIPSVTPRPRFQDRSPSDSALLMRRPPHGRNGDHSAVQSPLSPSFPPDEPRLRPKTQQGRPRGRTLDREIFRTVEAYLATCLSGCASLNASFFSARSTPARQEKSSRSRQIKQDPVEAAATPASEVDVFLSELDAKTLLLGDVVENGSWWTGKIDGREDVQAEPAREKSPDRWRGIVSAKSPRINWLELSEWHRLILHAGDDWRRRWQALPPTLSEVQLVRWHSIPLDILHRHIVESQVHLHRSFLKATENLLKRPRRPLSSPEDCRFLLMLLANPLLAPDGRVNTVRPAAESAETGASVNHVSPSKTPLAPPRHNSGLGRHSGIVKRILGLVGHLSDDIHLYMISWFSRLSDAHFGGLVELVGSFVTYRLTRQFSKPVHEEIDPTEGLIPRFMDGGVRHASQMHAALESRPPNSQKQKQDTKPRLGTYSEDWQVRAAARVMALLFRANSGHMSRKRDTSITADQRARSAGLNAKHQAYMHGQMIPISNFYNSMLDHADLVADFEAWENTKTRFTFCQYPFFLSIWAKIHILEHDARRQMETKAREAFFDSILSRKAVSQYLVLKVRRDCLVDDSLKSVSEAIGRGGNDVKKGLRIDFVGEEGIDAGGLRKEWFLLLVREIFNPNHGLFVYDDESQYCYFNPFCFESSEQFFLVGVLLGLAIYNSTILDVAFPPFLFKKMLASAPQASDKVTATPKILHQYTLEDLAELKPSLARGLRQLLDFEGDVQEVFCRDFIIEVERYGGTVQIPLCPGASSRPVTNANRHEFVGMYVHYLLDQSVARQYEPFKRGFFTVCGGNALSLFRPEEIELLICGSDEPLDVNSLRAVASYDSWPKHMPAEQQPQVLWFWQFFERLQPPEQRKMLSFITGSDRIPAMGATNLSIRIQLLLDKDASGTAMEPQRLPIARTCFNLLGLYQYHKREVLEQKLWTAVTLSEGFGMK